jgi:hypothetical protein
MKFGAFVLALAPAAAFSTDFTGEDPLFEEHRFALSTVSKVRCMARLKLKEVIAF